MFFGTLGLGHFYLGNNLRAVIQLVITIVSLYCILIYHASDAYTISMPATDGFPGITTSTVSLYDGAMVFGVVTFSIHFICSFFRGFDFFKSDAIEKKPGFETYIFISLIAIFGVYCNIENQESIDTIQNGVTVEKDLYYYDFELDINLGLSSVTIEIIPDYDSYDVDLDVELKKSDGEIISSYNITENSMRAGEKYSYNYSLSFSSIISVDKYGWQVTAKTSITYYAKKQ